MFIGHYAVAFGAKRYVASVSLGTLFLASQLADLIWPDLVLLGVERVDIDPGNTALTPLNFVYYPWSHSLLALALWGVLFAAVYAVIKRPGVRVFLVLALVVLSHWLLDFLTHRPDLPLTFGGSTLVGLGLWNRPVVATLVEVLLFAVGVWWYASHTRATDRQGRFGFWALTGFLALVYAANLLGPPPPSSTAVAWAAQAMWLLVIWGYWVDRHRVAIRAFPTP